MKRRKDQMLDKDPHSSTPSSSGEEGMHTKPQAVSSEQASKPTPLEESYFEDIEAALGHPTVARGPQQPPFSAAAAAAAAAAAPGQHIDPRANVVPAPFPVQPAELSASSAPPAAAASPVPPASPAPVHHPHGPADQHYQQPPPPPPGAQAHYQQHGPAGHQYPPPPPLPLPPGAHYQQHGPPAGHQYPPPPPLPLPPGAQAHYQQHGPAGQHYPAPPDIPMPEGGYYPQPDPYAPAYPPYGYGSQGGEYATAPNIPGRIDSYAPPGEGAGDAILPRISIRCFFERPFVQSALVAVMRDRRMNNVLMEIDSGGLSGAISYYAENPAPNLIVVESTLMGPQLFSQLDALAQHCDENVKVIVIGMANDVHLYRELMRRGVSEYMVPPIQPVQLIRAISSLFLDGDSPFTGRTIAVCGARGGIGASTIAHNLAWSCAEHINVATTLVDLDLNFGTVGLDFNQESMQSVADALALPDRLDISIMDRLVAKASGNLSLFNAPASLDSVYDFKPETYTQVIEQVRRTVPVVVLDLPHMWTPWVESVTAGADEIVVVASPDLTSLRNVQKMFAYFKAKRVNDEPPHLILNMTGVPRRPEIPVAEFTKVTDVHPALSIPFDPRLFGKAANNGQMLAMVDARAKCVADLDAFSMRVVRRQASRKNHPIVDKVLQILPGSTG